MEKVWRLILDEAREPYMNMAIDEAIMLCQMEGAYPPTLRIYKWLYPCISIGKFQGLDELLNLTADRQVLKNNLTIVRRPTGGGAVFHNEFSFTYSIVYQEKSYVLPKGALNSYRQIHVGILNAIKSLGIDAMLYQSADRQDMLERTGQKSLPSKSCFYSPVKFDIVWGKKKIAGAAQRRKYAVVLHQGEIGLDLDLWPKWSYNTLKNAVVASLSKELQARFLKDCLSEKEGILAEELKEKLKYQVSKSTKEEVKI